LGGGHRLNQYPRGALQDKDNLDEESMIGESLATSSAHGCCMEYWARPKTRISYSKNRPKPTKSTLPKKKKKKKKKKRKKEKKKKTTRGEEVLYRRIIYV